MSSRIIWPYDHDQLSSFFVISFCNHNLISLETFSSVQFRVSFSFSCIIYPQNNINISLFTFFIFLLCWSWKWPNQLKLYWAESVFMRSIKIKNCSFNLNFDTVNHFKQLYCSRYFQTLFIYLCGLYGFLLHLFLYP